MSVWWNKWHTQEYRNLPLLPLVIQWRTSPNFKSQQTKRLLMLRLLYICSWTFMAALCLCIRVQFIQDLWDVSLLISAAGILWICVKQTQFIKKKCDTYNSLLKICSEFKAKEKRVLCCSWCVTVAARMFMHWSETGTYYQSEVDGWKLPKPHHA